MFSGRADGVELQTADGMIAINPGQESYLNLSQTTQITLKCGEEFHTFAVQNAAASFRKGKLTVLAESVNPEKAEISEHLDPGL